MNETEPTFPPTTADEEPDSFERELTGDEFRERKYTDAGLRERDATGADFREREHTDVAYRERGVTDAEAREREFVEFVRAYPHVGADEVPASVWEAVRKGEPLASAYSRYENDCLRRENRSLRGQITLAVRERDNRDRSAGSQRGAGQGKRKAEWELAWDEE